MALRHLPVLGWSTKTDASGNVVPIPLDQAATNDVWKHQVYAFKDTALRNGLHGKFTVPMEYNGLGKFIVHWATTATTGNVVFDVDYRTVDGDNANSLDQTSNQESVTVTDGAGGAAWRRMVATLSPTAANFTADDTVQFTLFRDGTDAADTLAADVYLFELLFEFDVV